MWEFSGLDNYYMLYDHCIGNTNCIHTIVFNLEDETQVQLEQIRFWLTFLQSRIPPVEPLGKCIGFQVLIYVRAVVLVYVICICNESCHQYPNYILKVTVGAPISLRVFY